ncbi:neuronal nitric oxide synthase, related [Neospora caninum Liverpool]|uniref:ferredoxin--NADP(+) reductase n=1 Tax=Neospora caninum (strain Liverpool) TaxID=572307 RepID=F0V9Q4_NEOCL|nr:neuronal nitric oxide synthase, related [Neospora caninum Liverpool]CBZ50480.1 neuronal nitric oxide synthase, related [Neospora caninum Liverpool]CEL65090.1 TPA: Neuronal nitric oxide synthase, related [Neospora caninum Liverpool]|eukprot:XP_003880513.1 neuronal nitric oxide synthase, related [Neospora caninum Liverpool]
MIQASHPRALLAFFAVLAAAATSVQHVVGFRVTKVEPPVIDHRDTASCGARVGDASADAYFSRLRATAAVNLVQGYQARSHAVSSSSSPFAARQCSNWMARHCLAQSSERFVPPPCTFGRPLAVHLDRTTRRKPSDTRTGVFGTPEPTSRTHDASKVDELRVPINTFRPTSPLICRVVSVTPATSQDPAAEASDSGTPQVFSIVLDHGKQLPFVEGQSIGIMPPCAAPPAAASLKEQRDSPGAEASTSQKNSTQPGGQGLQTTDAPSVSKRRVLPRIYSIASSRDGDDGCGSTLTLCVRKHIYSDPVTGKRDRQKDGVCSTYICDAKRGDEIEVTGPIGKALLLPSNSETPLVMLATGTGVAPFRGHLQALRRIKNCDVPPGGPQEAPPAKKPRVLLFIGARTAAAVPYMNEWRDIRANRGREFIDIYFALSRQMQNPQGRRLYIQDVLWREREKVWKALKLDGGHLYACGLKRMMDGVHEVLGNMAEENGLPRDHLVCLLKQQRRWHVEVY